MQEEMKRTDIETLVRLGFEPARYFKRSAWTKVELVMEFLANKGLVVKTEGDVKYGMPHGRRYDDTDLGVLVEAYMKSPFTEHMDELRRLSRDTGLPLKSSELLRTYMNNFNTK